MNLFLFSACLVVVILITAANVASSPSSPFFVSSLPGAPPSSPGRNFEQYAGRIPVDDGYGGQLFFWLFTKENTTLSTIDGSIPLIIWLNGGPGCSSLLGLLSEQGAWRPLPDGSALKFHEYSWQIASHIMYVDSPVGTGFSFANQTFAKNENDVSRDFVAFLRNFYRAFPSLVSSKIIISGESYAGHYIPRIGRAIFESEFSSNLLGIAIGNGWIDPHSQTRAYVDYAFGRSLVGVLEYEQMNSMWQQCTQEVEKDGGKSGINVYDTGTCGKIMGFALNLAGNPNQYDVRTYVQYDFLYDTSSGMYRYLNSDLTKAALHLPSDAVWQCCNDVVGKHMNCDQPLSMLPDLAMLLDAGKRVLLYSGESDYNCNFLGTQSLSREIEWKGQDSYRQTNRGLWKPKNLGGKTPYGFVNEYQNLSFLVISNCGHLVPFDQPEASLDLVRRFISLAPYDDSAAQAYETADSH